MSTPNKFDMCTNRNIISFRADKFYTLKPLPPPILPWERVPNNILIMKGYQDIFRAILI